MKLVDTIYKKMYNKGIHDLHFLSNITLIKSRKMWWAEWGGVQFAVGRDEKCYWILVGKP